MNFIIYAILSVLFVSQVFAQIPGYETVYYDQFLDHFNQHDSRTFKQRYLINDDWFNPTNGSILLYPGNEASIELFWNNTGFIFDIAPQLQSLVIFIEHRYYGNSLPFGNSSFDDDKVGYLNVEQALADYVVIINDLKRDFNLTNPVIAIGGSYGGMLAAYLRFKYPNLIDGALASSAPMYLATGLSPNNIFFQDVTNVYNACVPLVRQAFSQMENLFKQGDFETLTSKLKLCSPISNQADFTQLIYWARNVFTVMSMANYPYPASFLANLPGWPVNYSCEYMHNQTAKGVDILTVFKEVAGFVYNDSIPCFDIYAEYTQCADPIGCSLLSDGIAWSYQSCTELYTYQESNNVTDMFPPLALDKNIRKKYCQQEWGLDGREGWMNLELWGQNIGTASNIVFSNGLLDPLHRGSPQNNFTSDLLVISIKDGAHHFDLRGANPADPQSVIDARAFELEQIKKWIQNAKEKNL